MRSTSRVRDNIMSTSDKICKEGASKSSDDGAKDIEGMLLAEYEHDRGR